MELIPSGTKVKVKNLTSTRTPNQWYFISEQYVANRVPNVEATVVAACAGHGGKVYMLKLTNGKEAPYEVTEFEKI